MATTPPDGPSIGDLLRQLIDDVQHLFKTELRSFQSEVRGNIAGMSGGAAMIAVGGVFMLAALITLFAAFVGWLTPVVGPGWAALIVAVVSAVLGLILLSVGRKRLSGAGLAPGRTLESLRQDAETLKGN